MDHYILLQTYSYAGKTQNRQMTYKNTNFWQPEPCHRAVSWYYRCASFCPHRQSKAARAISRGPPAIIIVQLKSRTQS